MDIIGFRRLLYNDFIRNLMECHDLVNSLALPAAYNTPIAQSDSIRHAIIYSQIMNHGHEI